MTPAQPPKDTSGGCVAFILSVGVFAVLLYLAHCVGELNKRVAALERGAVSAEVKK